MHTRTYTRTNAHTVYVTHGNSVVPDEGIAGVSVAERATGQVLCLDECHEQFLGLSLVLDGEPDPADVVVRDVVVVVFVSQLIQTRIDGADGVGAWNTRRTRR